MDSLDDKLEEFRRFLPHYLSPDEKQGLFKELSQFPDNMDERLYTTRQPAEEAIYQGDGLPNVCICDLPRPDVKFAPVMVISNSCDTAPKPGKENLGRLLYCPIMRLERYAQAVSADTTYLDTIRKNRVTTLFYLPPLPQLGGEAIALMDRINNCSVTELDINGLIMNRLFMLSDYGFYLFLFKLSIHLTRMGEAVSRS